MPRYNLFPAAEVQGATLPGFSTGQAIAAMEKIVAANLPSGFGFEWTEIALQEKVAGNTAAIAFSLAVVFVFLLLAAQYESVLLPLAVILIVPMCLLAAISGVLLRGMDNNILTQIGFVVLIGLAAKNAILIVEFAKQAEEQGADRWDAAVQAARTRLRPILMTSFAFILGVVPLVHRDRRRRRDAAGARHGGVLRHARRDAVRAAVHAGVLCAGALDRHARRAKTTGRTGTYAGSRSRVIMSAPAQSIIDTRRHQMFPLLEPAEIERVRRFGKVRSYRAGEALAKVGQVSDGLTIILAGKVDITQHDESGRRTPIVTHTTGAFMGELAQLAGRPALVDAYAQEPVEALIIPPDRLRALLVAEAELGERIMRALILRRVGLLETGAGGPVIVGPRREWRCASARGLSLAATAIRVKGSTPRPTQRRRR